VIWCVRGVLTSIYHHLRAAKGGGDVEQLAAVFDE
jgi:hypothetical protein